MIRVTPSELVALADEQALELTSALAPVTAMVAVELDELPDLAVARAAARAAKQLGVVLVGMAATDIGDESLILVKALTCTLVGGRATSAATIAVPDVEEAVTAIDHAVRQAPRAALTLVRVLQATAQLNVWDALAVESAAYSMLLAGPEFAAWRASRPFGRRAWADGPAVLLAREGATLSIMLNRPARHNAFSVEMRDGLIEALEVALCDETIERVSLAGAGPSFCSGGDLDEFGTTPDVVTAHLVRLDRSVAARVDRLGARLSVLLHGACIGAGVEIPSFAGRVEAREDAFFLLPELSMGLIPGAGGTVGITRRIGRWRTAYLCLRGAPLTLEVALDWKLVDRRATA